MSQSLDGAPSRLCRKPGEICSIRTTGMPISFPGAAAPCPHIRTAAILGDSFHFILYCRFLVGCANPSVRPVLLLSANPSTPSRHRAGSCRAFPGRKKVVRRQKIRFCARCCRPGSFIPQLRSLPPSSKLFSKKGVKKFARKEKGYTFAAANEVKRSNPSGLEKRRRGH